MLHDGLVSGAGATILIPIDRYLQVFLTTHLVVLPYVICISLCFSSPPYFQASRRHLLSPSPARQHHIAGHLSSDERTLLDRLSSLFWPNHYGSQNAPSPMQFLEWARKPFFNSPRRQDDEGHELQERLPEVVDVPFTAGQPVSLPFSISDHSTLHTSYRGTSQRHKSGRRKKKREQRKPRTLVQAAHGLLRSVSCSNPAEQLRLIRL